MFFWLSKTIGALLVPPAPSLVLLLCWLVCRLLRRAERLGRWALWLGVATLLLFSLPVVGDLLLYPLESAHPRLQRPKKVAAIILFAGATVKTSGEYELNAAADRFFETLRLARQYPQAQVIITGGSGQLLETSHREAPVLARLAAEQGVTSKRLFVDDQARNTYENAVNAARLLKRVEAAKSDSAVSLLVTSASHMPRSLGCLKNKTSRRVIPWPVDFRRGPLELGSFVPGIGGLGRSRIAIKEYLGLLAYWLAGYL